MSLRVGPLQIHACEVTVRVKETYTWGCYLISLTSFSDDCQGTKSRCRMSGAFNAKWTNDCWVLFCGSNRKAGEPIFRGQCCKKTPDNIERRNSWKPAVNCSNVSLNRGRADY